MTTTPGFFRLGNRRVFESFARVIFAEEHEFAKSASQALRLYRSEGFTRRHSPRALVKAARVNLLRRLLEVDLDRRALNRSRDLAPPFATWQGPHLLVSSPQMFSLMGGP